VRRGSREDTNIIFGATIDERLTGQVWVTVVATGLDGPKSVRPRPTASTTGDSDILEPPSFLQN
jgi:cell division GTPase FtsZ